MKLFFFSLFLIIAPFSAIQADGCCYTEVLYSKCHGPSQALLNVLNAYDVDHGGNWEQIVTVTQEKWLRPADTSRWEIRDRPYLEGSYALFSALGMTQSREASDCFYRYGAVFGGSVKMMRQRLWFLKQEWDRGVHFRELVLLTGERSLSPRHEGPTVLLTCPYPMRPGFEPPEELPKTETEAFLFLIDQLDLPDSWRSKITLINSPERPGGKRPRTIDTLRDWMAFDPTPGSVLFVSNQPFIPRQDLIARQILPQSPYGTGFVIDTIGPGFTKEEMQALPNSTGILLDDLARWIYEAITPCLSSRQESTAMANT